MKKKPIILSLSVLLIILILFFFLATELAVYQFNGFEKSPDSTSLSIADFDNFRLDFIKTENGEPAALKHGKYKCTKLGYYNIVSLGDRCVSIDDSKHANPYYGGIVVVESGGSGSFFYLVLFHKGISVAHKFLGDRIRVKSIYFLNNQLQAEYFVRTPEQSMVDVPTLLRQAKIDIREE